MEALHTFKGSRAVYVSKSSLSEQDLDNLHEMLSDHKTMKYLMAFAGQSREVIAAWMKERSEKQAQGKAFNVFVYVDECLIGFGGFNTIKDKEGEFGVILHHTHWRGGIGAEASLLLLEYGFTTLGLERAVFYTDPKNAPVIETCKKFGITNEGLVQVAEYGEAKGQSFSVSLAQWKVVKAKLEYMTKRYVRSVATLAKLYERIAKHA